MRSFVFLEIADRDLNHLLLGIEEILTNKRPKRAAHLTIRGPYKGHINHETLKLCQDRLQQDVLDISGVGRFSNPKEEVVYLKVASPNLRRVWWKPDYPIKEFEFNPHISIYRGPDKELAAQVGTFFDHERLQLYCAEFKIVTRVSKNPQLELFEPREEVPRSLVASGRINPNLLDRLTVLVRRHQRQSSAGADARPSSSLADGYANTPALARG